MMAISRLILVLKNKLELLNHQMQILEVIRVVSRNHHLKLKVVSRNHHKPNEKTQTTTFLEAVGSQNRSFFEVFFRGRFWEASGERLFEI
mgnify:CR=1 FL=1